jgi:hypothetical protein
MTGDQQLKTFLIGTATQQQLILGQVVDFGDFKGKFRGNKRRDLTENDSIDGHGKSIISQLTCAP